MRIAYTYFMRADPRIVEVAPDHAKYWHSLALTGYLGGPYTDRSGGLIVFEVDSFVRAKSLVASDPFVRAGLLEQSWVKEWAPE